MTKATVSRNLFRILLALLAVLLFTAIRVLFLQSLGTKAVYITFFPAVILSSLFLGISGSLTSIVLSALAADYFFMDPRGSILIQTPSDVLSLVIFLINCALISTLVLAHNHHRERVDRLKHENELFQERLRSAESVNVLANRLKLSLESVRAGTWDWNLRTNQNTWSQEIWNLYGLSPHEVEPSFEAWLGTVHPEDRERLSKAVTLAAQAKEELNIEWKVNGLGEEERWLMSRGRPTLDESGNATDYIGIVIDITDRKNLEKEKIGMLMKVQQAQKLESLGSLAGGIAHDINTALAIILTTSSTNIKKHEADSVTYKALSTIIRAAEKGGKMVKTLLNFSRHRPAAEAEINLNDILQKEGILLQHAVPIGVRINHDLQEGLRPIRGDSSGLISAVINLCVNASDAMPDGGDLTIRTRNLNDSRVELQIQDTGQGMTDEVLRRATEPFFTTKPSGKGTGLGLALVYNMITSHKGELDIQSKLGEGTTVSLRFPSCDFHVKPVEEKKESQQVERLSILLVDDEDLLREVIKESLEFLGHQVRDVSRGEAAVDLFESGSFPDLVILDMSMPGLGGKRTLLRLRELNSQVPILLSTGLSDQSAVELVAESSEVFLLPKPFTVDELREKLASVMLNR